MLNRYFLNLLKSAFDELIDFPMAYPVSFAKCNDWTRKCPFTWCMYLYGNEFGAMDDTTISRFFTQIVDGDCACPFGMSPEQFNTLFGAQALQNHTWSQIGSTGNKDFNDRAVMSELHARRRYLEELIAVAVRTEGTPPESSPRPFALAVAQ